MEDESHTENESDEVASIDSDESTRESLNVKEAIYGRKQPIRRVLLISNEDDFT